MNTIPKFYIKIVRIMKIMFNKNNDKNILDIIYIKIMKKKIFNKN